MGIVNFLLEGGDDSARTPRYPTARRYARPVDPYVPSPTRYDDATFRRCGRSGLLLPPISLGLWHNFGNCLLYTSMCIRDRCRPGPARAVRDLRDTRDREVTAKTRRSRAGSLSPRPPVADEEWEDHPRREDYLNDPLSSP